MYRNYLTRINYLVSIYSSFKIRILLYHFNHKKLMLIKGLVASEIDIDV